MEHPGPIKEIGDQLGRIFRHLLPGVLVLAMARASHPRWFVGRLDWSDPWQLAVVATIAVMVGNTCYVLHRYIVHLAVEFPVYSLRTHTPLGYPAWLAKHIHDRSLFPSRGEELRQSILIRSGQVMYLYMLGEVLFFFALQPASGTVVARYRTELLWGSLVILVFACLQYFLTLRMDEYAVEQLGPDGRGGTPLAKG